VYLLVRRDAMRASKPMQQRVLDHEKIEVIWNTSVTELRGEPVLSEVELTDTATGEKSSLEINGLFVAIGHTPNTKFLGDALELDHGFIKVIGHSKTSIPSVFVAGDVADPHYQQAIMAAGAGCAAAMDAEQFLSAK